MASTERSIRALLGNRGIGTDFGRQPSEHPYLFFRAEDVPRIRERAQRPPYQACAEGILRTARLTLANPIPPEPPAGAEKAWKADGVYDDSFLKATYDFLSYAYALEYYAPLYAFAYVLTGEKAFAERAKAWVLAYAGWSHWGPAADPYDMEGAMILSGAVIAYDWIADQFTAEERARLLAGLRRNGQALCAHDARWLANEPAKYRGGLANNHRWRSIPLEGLAGLGLLHEVPEARDWLDMGFVLTRDYLLPAAYGRDGERMEGRGWLGVCLSDGGRFMEAVRRAGGPDLFDYTPLRQLAHFLTYGMEMYRSRGSSDDRAGLLIHASRLRDPLMQWLALAQDLKPPEDGYPSYWYNRDKVLYAPEQTLSLALRWDAPNGETAIRVDGQVRDRQAISPVAGIDHAVLHVDGDELEVRSLVALDAPGTAVARLEGPRTLPGGGDLKLTFAALPAGELQAVLRKRRSDAGSASVTLMAGETAVRGVVLTNAHEITKHVPGMAGSYSLGVHAARGLHFHGPWEYLFFDETLAPAAPVLETPSQRFRDLGLVLSRDTFDARGVHVTFTCGPEISKEQGDKNAFTLRAFGESLLTLLPTPKTGDAKLTQAQYDLTAWFQGTKGRNTILVDGRGQPAVHEPSPVPREENLQWLGAPEVVKSGVIEETFFAPDYDYMRGEAAHAYRPLLHRFRRHLLFVKPQASPDLRYLVLFDEIETAGDTSHPVEWRLLTSLNSVSTEHGVTRIAGSRASLHVTHLAPDPSTLHLDRTPAPREADQHLYLRFPTSEPVRRVQYLHVLQPLRQGAPVSALQAERVEGQDGMGARIHVPDGPTLAVFRTGKGPAMVGEMHTDARAALVQARGGRAGSVAVHGGTFVDWAGQRVFAADAPVSAWMEYGAAVRGRVVAERSTWVWLPVPEGAGRVRVDGTPVGEGGFRRLPGGIVTLQIGAGEHAVEVSAG